MIMLTPNKTVHFNKFCEESEVGTLSVIVQFWMSAIDELIRKLTSI